MKLHDDVCRCGHRRFHHEADGSDEGGRCLDELVGVARERVVVCGRGACTCAGFAPRCCDLHNAHCEPPADLCCCDCTEAAHPHHGLDGSPCVLAAAT